MNFVKLRSSTGRSVICFDSNVVATSARSVLSSGLTAVTSTLSLTAPADRLKSAFVCASTPTTTLRTDRLS